MKKGALGKVAVAVVGGLFLILGSVVFLVTLFSAVLDGEGDDGWTCKAVAADGSGGVPEQWRDEVEDAAAEAGVPASVLAAQIAKESGWDETAVNTSSGAAGIAQFMPATWGAYGRGDPLDGADAIAAMGRYMGALMDLSAEHHDEGPDRISGALGAYNWGPGNMDAVDWDWSQGPSETTAYVAAIMDTAQVEFSQECDAVAYEGDLGDGEWAAPLPGGRLISGFGLRNVAGLPLWAQNHVGLDFATDDGGQVVAPTDLRVTAVYEPDGCVMARATTEPHFGFAFCHMNSWSDAKEFKRGDVVGQEGAKAASVGTSVVRHLHFELYHPEAPDPQFPGPDAPGVIDPTPILRAKGVM